VLAPLGVRPIGVARSGADVPVLVIRSDNNVIFQSRRFRAACREHRQLTLTKSHTGTGLLRQFAKLVITAAPGE